MIDSSALLLAIVLTTPAEYLDEQNNNQYYVSFNSLGDMMQRLCWPHTHTMNMECEAKSAPTASFQGGSEQDLTKALNTFKSLKKREHFSKHQ